MCWGISDSDAGKIEHTSERAFEEPSLANTGDFLPTADASLAVGL